MATGKNHILAAAIPVKNKFIANSELAAFFITKSLVKFGDCLLVDKSDRKERIKALKEIRRSLKRGNNLIIFPESSMSYNGLLQEFKRAGLSAATSTDVCIIPICIKGTREVCPPGAFSFNLNKDVYVIFDRGIDCKNLSREDKKNIDTIVYNNLIKLSEEAIH